MCFSAEASFIATAILGAAGIATLRVASHAAYRWLASVPLLFALQQFSEGVLWLNMPLTPESPWIATFASYLFMFYAYLFWPVYIPFALFMAEERPVRKAIIGACTIAGLAMVSFFLWNFSIAEETPVTISIVGHSLQYSANDPMFRTLYVIIVLIPCFISSIRWIKIFGILIAISVFATEYYFASVFVSVWCFFAAIISLVLFGILKANRT